MSTRLERKEEQQKVSLHISSPLPYCLYNRGLSIPTKGHVSVFT